MAIDRQKLVNAAHRLLGTCADAEDAVQDTYVRAFDTFSDWRAPEPAWMYTVLRILCCRAIEAREPALLMEMLQGISAQAQACPAPVCRETGARSTSMLVQINGRYAIALVLDGVVLCIVPVGVQAMRSGEAAARGRIQ
jgi:DNA-directed RNA polymerase specialized sigma24 family protein